MTESEASTILKAEIIHHPECSIFAEALGIAIQALEKQIPKKAVHDGCFDSKGMWHEWNGVNGRPYDLCPNCNTNLCCEMPCDSKPNYCSKCGCRLDWSDNNEID